MSIAPIYRPLKLASRPPNSRFEPLKQSGIRRRPAALITAAQGLRLFTNSHGVFNVTGSVQFNIFDSGRIKADILENDAELRNRRNEFENLRGQIDFEVRSALLDLRSANDQVDVAKSNMQFANETLKQSRDRFTAGVTNTVEVVQAQQAVADANENLISAQFQYNLAKVALARSLGLAEEKFGAFSAIRSREPDRTFIRFLSRIAFGSRIVRSGWRFRFPIEP